MKRQYFKGRTLGAKEFLTLAQVDFNQGEPFKLARMLHHSTGNYSFGISSTVLSTSVYTLVQHIGNEHAA